MPAPKNNTFAEAGYSNRLNKIVATGHEGGFILFSESEWAAESNADYEADETGAITLLGQKTGDSLTVEEMQNARA